LGILRLQPSGNLLGRPVQEQFTGNDLSQPWVQRQMALVGPQSRLPGVVIRLMRPIGGTATMACDLPAHRRSRSIQVSGDLTNRRAGSNPPRDVLALARCEGYPGASARFRRNSLHEATTNSEWSYVACQRRARSHAASARPSIDARFRSSRSQKVQTVSLASYNTTLARSLISDGVASTC